MSYISCLQIFKIIFATAKKFFPPENFKKILGYVYVFRGYVRLLTILTDDAIVQNPLDIGRKRFGYGVPTLINVFFDYVEIHLIGNEIFIIRKQERFGTVQLSESLQGESKHCAQLIQFIFWFFVSDGSKKKI